MLARAEDGDDPTDQLPEEGDHGLRILSHNLKWDDLEAVRFTIVGSFEEAQPVFRRTIFHQDRLSATIPELGCWPQTTPA